MTDLELRDLQEFRALLDGLSRENKLLALTLAMQMAAEQTAEKERHNHELA